jgi:hypothetical protein
MRVRFNFSIPRFKVMLDSKVVAYCEAMGDWNEIDPRIFFPQDDGEFSPMSDQLAMALFTAAALEGGEDGVSEADIGEILDFVNDRIVILSILRAVLLGGVGIRWDSVSRQIIFRLVDSPEECTRRRDILAKVLAPRDGVT